MSERQGGGSNVLKSRLEVVEALAGVPATGKSAMGQAMKAAQAAVGRRADGARVAAEVRRQLG